MEMNSTFGGSSACTVLPITETNNANATLNVSRILIPLFQMIYWSLVAIVAVGFAGKKADAGKHYYLLKYVWR